LCDFELISVTGTQKNPL